ncbi:MFS transporter [Streptomyces globisporus]|uniref:MFS transporter n=1 Tax=Streptomyces globisporus TaxID=1908 RepID=UPI0037A66630
MTLATRPTAKPGGELRRAYWGTAAAFLFSGLLLSTWLARIPAVKENTGLAAGTLGSVMMVSVLGSLLSMQVADRLIGILGSRATVRISLPVAALALWTTALARDGVQLSLALLVFGLADGLLYVAMNVQGVEVERRSGRPCLSVFHASWSIGALAAAVFASGFTWAEWSVSGHFLGVAVFTAALSVPLLRGLLLTEPDGDRGSPPDEGGKGGHWNRRIALLGGLGLCCLVAQGALEDWGAVFITEDLRGSPFTATIGFTAFCAMLTLGRLAGDRLRARFETAQLLRAFAAMAVAGLTVSLVSSTSAGAVIGFGLFGWGLSILDPIISSAAGHSAEGGEKETAAAVSQVAMLGHTGLLLGPPAIGWLSELVGLRSALIVPGVFVLIVGAGASFIARVFPAATEK